MSRTGLAPRTDLDRTMTSWVGVKPDGKMADWVRFEPGGRVQVRNGKVELGQGIGTAIAQIAAEELGVPLDVLDLVSGDTGLCPNEWWTSASISIERGGLAVRIACAEVRETFAAAAARRLGVDPATLTVRDGSFVSATGGSIDYWRLLDEVDLHQEITGNVAPKPSSAYRVVGRSVPRRDLPRKLSGAAYVHDLDLPDMWHGRIVRPPSSDAQLAGVDEEKLRSRVPAVQIVVNGRFVGVVAPREEDALRAIAVAQTAVRWTTPADLPDPSGMVDWLHGHVRDSTELAERSASKPNDTQSFHATYSKPYLAHASIGPACAVAEWRESDGIVQGLTVWSQTQGNYGLRSQLAMALGVPEEIVRVIHQDGAGCYGHNGADDVALDAALLSRALGRPVRVVWSREDELVSAPFGPAMTMDLSAELAADGAIVDWKYQVYSPPHLSRPGWGEGVGLLAAWHLAEPFAQPAVENPSLALGGGGDRNAVPPYVFPNQSVIHHFIQRGPLRSSALRALGAFGNVFSIECFMDELAAASNADPLAFRLRHLTDERARATLERVTAVANAAPTAPDDGEVRGRGLGFSRYKNSAAYCAVVAEVRVDERVHVERVWAAVDAGLVVNPDGLLNQIEGGIVQAVSWTLIEEVKWDENQVLTRDWESYPILSFSEVPAIEVVLLDADDRPSSGVGECAAGPTAAAIGNALFDALGVRVRDLPLTPERIAAAM